MTAPPRAGGVAGVGGRDPRERAGDTPGARKLSDDGIPCPLMPYYVRCDVAALRSVFPGGGHYPERESRAPQ